MTCRLGHREVVKTAVLILIARRFNGIVSSSSAAQFNDAFGFEPLFIIFLRSEVGDRTDKQEKRFVKLFIFFGGQIRNCSGRKL